MPEPPLPVEPELPPLLFPPEENYEEEFSGSDAATRSLSTISLETSVVEAVYSKMASVYDVFFGLPLPA